ncbi:type II toxin-antitoxin system RelB/DinJ family antitoxin [Levilactobacillus mulengensis]|uniref:type II toxin-antitoxin system RelB/DinJ family antitoxin n=1 Tax=Levilactobacillus mulengensis TaxID=2486025 RepID=UPI000F76956F|nr:type II toxin-antitoxin system RelB/DinJ family antitoxin [Levilactobacillus mulengensis]
MHTKANDQINFRISPVIKLRAQNVLAKNGLTISEYTRMVLTHIAEHGLSTQFAQPTDEVIESILEMADVISGNKHPENIVTSRQALNRMLNG